MPDRSLVSVLIIVTALLATIPTHRELSRAGSPPGGALTSGFHTHLRASTAPDPTAIASTGSATSLVRIVIQPGGEAVSPASPGAALPPSTIPRPGAASLRRAIAANATGAATETRDRPGGIITPATTAPPLTVVGR